MDVVAQRPQRMREDDRAHGAVGLTAASVENEEACIDEDTAGVVQGEAGSV